MLSTRRLCSVLAAAVRSASSACEPPEFLIAEETTKAGSGGGTGKLGRQLLSLVYPKRSAAVVLRKWVEEGRTLQKYQLNRVVRELRSYRRYKHALEICEWMVIEKDIKLLPGDYAVHLDLVAKVRGLASAEKFFEDLPNKVKGQSTCTALLHTYVQNKQSSKAESLMKEMAANGLLNCDLPFNHMISLYISNGELDKVPKMIKELKKYTKPTEFTYNLYLNACSIKDDVEGAEEVFLEMKERRINPDWFTYSTLTSMYIKARLLEKAKEALEEMERRVSRKERSGYCSLISLYANLPDRENVFRIWRKMKSTFRKMSDVEYKCMLSSLVKLGDLKEAESIYAEWEKVSGTRDSRVPNILLGYYTTNDMMNQAEKFHKHTIQVGIKPSYSTWEILGLGYLREKKMETALDCLEKALLSVEKWEPNTGIVKAVFSKLEKLGHVEGAERFLSMLRDAGYMTTEIYNFVLRTYAKAGKMPLIIAERMKMDCIQMDDETWRLINLTGNFSVGSVSALIS